MAGRVSQKVVEALYTPTPALRVSQVAVEVLYTPSGRAARASQVAVEVLYQPPPPKVGLQIIWID